MSRPCRHGRDGLPPAPDECRVCFLFVTDVKYRRLWGDAKGSFGRCRHLGEPMGEVRLCGSCAGKVQLKLLTCAVHGKCTVGQKVAGIKCCRTCPDREPAQLAESGAAAYITPNGSAGG